MYSFLVVLRITCFLVQNTYNTATSGIVWDSPHVSQQQFGRLFVTSTALSIGHITYQIT